MGTTTVILIGRRIKELRTAERLSEDILAARVGLKEDSQYCYCFA